MKLLIDIKNEQILLKIIWEKFELADVCYSPFFEKRLKLLINSLWDIWTDNGKTN